MTLRDIYGATSNVELKVTLPSRAVLGRERERRDTTRTEREQQVNFKEQEGVCGNGNIEVVGQDLVVHEVRGLVLSYDISVPGITKSMRWRITEFTWL